MLFQWVLVKLSAEQKTVKLLWVAYLSSDYSMLLIGISACSLSLLQALRHTLIVMQQIKGNFKNCEGFMGIFFYV